MASLRLAASTRSLVVQTTGLTPQAGDNFQTALKYVQHNLKHHQFADSGNDGFAVRTMYEGLIQLLENHSEHAKAAALRALCDALCVPSHQTLAAWDWSPEHASVGRGVEILAALYWLSNAKEMIHRPAGPEAGDPPKSISHAALLDALASAALREKQDIEKPGDEEPNWGFSDAEDEADGSGDDQNAGDEEHTVVAAGARASLKRGGETAPSTLSATGRCPESVHASLWPHSMDAVNLALTARLGTPPSHLHLGLLVHGSNSSPWCAGGEQEDWLASCCEVAKDEWRCAEAAAKEERLTHLRILRETLRRPLVSFNSASGATITWPVSHAPTVLSELEEVVARMQRLSSFASLLGGLHNSPAVFVSLADAIAHELLPIRAMLVTADCGTRHAQLGAGTNRADRSSRRRASGQPSFSAIAELLRDNGDGCTTNGARSDAYPDGGAFSPPGKPPHPWPSARSFGSGWLRRLSRLEVLRGRLLASAELRALLSSAGHHMSHDEMMSSPAASDTVGDAVRTISGFGEGDKVAAAASHAINTLFALLREDQLVQGACGELGAPFEDHSEALLILVWLRLLAAALGPYLRLLGRWTCDGRLPEDAAELPVTIDASVPLDQVEEHWRRSATLRPDNSIPSALRPVAPALLLAGKSCQLLHRIPIAEHEPSQATSDAPCETPPIERSSCEPMSLDEAFCEALLEMLCWLPAAEAHGASSATESHGACKGGARGERPGGSRSGGAAKGQAAVEATVWPSLPGAPTFHTRVRPLPLYLSSDAGLRPCLHSVVPRTRGDPTAEYTGTGAGGDLREGAGSVVEGNLSDVDDGGDDLGKHVYGMRQCASDIAPLQPAAQARSTRQRLRMARRSLCSLPCTIPGRTPPVRPLSARSRLHAAFGSRALELSNSAAYHRATRATDQSASSGEPSSLAKRGGSRVSPIKRAGQHTTAIAGVTTPVKRIGPSAAALASSSSPLCGEMAASSAALSLPPLSLLIERSLLSPVLERCALPGPQLLSAISRTSDPIGSASLLHRVLLFGEPRLTSPVFDDLFARLTVHRAWRRQLPELNALLTEGLIAADVSLEKAHSFMLELRPHASQVAASATALMRGGAAAAGGGGLDVADVRALHDLMLHYVVGWPLQLAISDKAIACHERVFALLLRLRRARWALETVDSTAADASATGGRERGGINGWHSAHPWRVLRAEVLHLISALYSHFTLGVIHPAWRDFASTAPSLFHLDDFRAAHEAFAQRVLSRCLLEERHAPIHAAIERVLGLGLRLRMQLEMLPRLSAKAHAASAVRWRAELRVGVRFVLDELRRAMIGEAGGSGELIELINLLNYNGFYS